MIKKSNSKKQSDKNIECHTDKTHEPYYKIGKQGQKLPQWNNHPTISGAKLCGLCYQKLTHPPKFSPKERKRHRSDRFKKNNPMKDPKIAKKISRQQKGGKNSFYGKHHTSKTKKIQSKKVSGAKNARFGEKRAGTKAGKKQSRKMKKLFKTGKWIPHPQPKGEDNPLFKVPRSKTTKQKISARLKDKKKTRKHKASLAVAAAKQKFKKADNANERRCEELLKKMKVTYFVQPIRDKKRLNEIPDEIIKKVALCKTKLDFFVPQNIVIFADGDYTHANPNRHQDSYHNGRWLDGFKASKIIRGGKTAAWKRKMDKKARKCLEDSGFIVVPLWDSDISYNEKDCIKKIRAAIKESKNSKL